MTYLHFFVSGRAMMGLSIAPTPMQEVWRPTLQHAAVSDGGSKVVAAKPSLPGVVPSGSAVDVMAAVVSVLAAIPVPTVGVTLAAPPPPVAVEEAREAKLPISPGGGPPSSSLPSGPKAPEESAAGTESGHLAVVHVNEVVVIPSDDEVDIAAEPPVSP